MKSYWEQYPDAKSLVVRMCSRNMEQGDPPNTYQGIRNAIKAAYHDVPLPSDSQIYRLKRDSGFVDAGRGKTGPGRRKNLPTVKPELKESAQKLSENVASRGEIGTQIGEEFGLEPSDWQARTLLGYAKPVNESAITGENRAEKEQIYLDPLLSKGEEKPDSRCLGNDDRNTPGLRCIPGGASVPPGHCAAENAYMRPYATPLLAKKAPRKLPLALRDRFIADLVQYDSLPEGVGTMLTHDPLEGCKFDGVIRQSRIGCLKRQVTAGHPWHIRTLGGGGKTLNLFYIRCPQCGNIISDEDYRVMIEDVKQPWQKRASERAKFVA